MTELGVSPVSCSNSRWLFMQRSLRSALAAIGALMLTAGPAIAAECNLDVMAAYQTAKARGWQFNCNGMPGLVAKGFVTYPPSAIGCTFKTGAVIPPGNPQWGMGQGLMMLFGAQLGTPVLKNGWQFVRYEIGGGTFQILPQVQALVASGAKLGSPNKTYNYKLTKLVLSKSGGQCSKAEDEAF